MGSWCVGSRTTRVAAGSSRSSGTFGCGVGAEASPVVGAPGVKIGGEASSDLDTSSGSGCGRFSDGPASYPYSSSWRSMRSSPRSFSTFLLKSTNIRSIFGVDTTSGFFIHWSYNLALVTTSPANPTKAWNFLAMVTTFSWSSSA